MERKVSKGPGSLNRVEALPTIAGSFPVKIFALG